MPTRWYVRSLYILGSFFLYNDKFDKADEYLKGCLAVDIHDKLGARHKLLLGALMRLGLDDTDELPYLLDGNSPRTKSKTTSSHFGTTLALFTNSRKKAIANHLES
mmetsp:Transcript_16279/g.41915  ORF Transcript_16279/g.41915 Transcript_16279/m.41915 type:complete len:106 (-) Transcript_16279:890-1207(-)